jgi:hypothetical protein
MWLKLPAAANILVFHTVNESTELQPPSYPMRTDAFPIGLKRVEGKAEHSRDSSSEINNAYICTSTLLYDFKVYIKFQFIF